MTYIDEVHLYSDGGCRGNPGPGAIGFIIFDKNGNQLYEYNDCIGQTTNNRAEYEALIEGLRKCTGFTRKNVKCFLDSELVVKQLTGVYRIKNQTLLELFDKVKVREKPFSSIIYQHVKRTHKKMRKADALVNSAFAGL